MSSVTSSARHAGFAMLAAAFVSLPALAAPPAAPQVTVGADIKELKFDWDIVPRSNWYEFWYRADNGSPWVKISESRPWNPHAVHRISAHLFNWDQARYQVKACNPSGCAATSNIAVHDQMFDSIGYFKPSQSFEFGLFGTVQAIAEDGQTLAAFTPYDNPLRTGTGPLLSGIYVFAKLNGVWRQQARLVPPDSGTLKNNAFNDMTEATLSFSADGTRLVAGMPLRDAAGHLFQETTIYRRSVTTWAIEQRFVSADGGVVPLSDTVAQIDAAGSRIAVRRRSDLPVELLERGAGGWTRHAAIAQPPANVRCQTTLSGDGNALAWGCWDPTTGRSHVYVSRAPSWAIDAHVPVIFPPDQALARISVDYSAARIAVASEVDFNSGDRHPQVLVLTLSGGAWQTGAPILAGSWNSPNVITWYFADSIALSRNGGWLAIHDFADSAKGLGVQTPPIQPNGRLTNGVYVYDLRAQVPRLRRLVKPNTEVFENPEFQGSVAFANDGKTLLISDPSEQSGATGIDGDRHDISKYAAGALWLY